MSDSPPLPEGLSESKRRLFELLMRERAAAKVVAAQGLVTGDVAITPPQAHEFAIHNPDRHIFNLPLLLEAHVPLDLPALERIVAALLEHHDALRLRSAQEAGGWRQWIAPPPERPPVTFVDLSPLAGDAGAQRAALEGHVAALQRSFDLARAPLFKAALFELGGGQPPRLLLLAQHIACDHYSTSILAADFLTAYGQVSAGAPVALPPKTTSYLDWSRRLAQYGSSAEALAELPYWLGQDWRAARPIPADFPGGLNLGESAALAGQQLDASGCAGLAYQRLKAHDTQLHHVLVCAVARALTDWAGGDAALISLCQHGRQHPFKEIDLSRTVGWFSHQHPLLVELGGATGGLAQLRRARAALDGVPQQGLGYGALRYMGEPQTAGQLAALPEPDIFLNIRVGTQIALPGFAPAREDTGEAASRTIVRPRALYLNIDVNDQQIGFQCLYNTRIHRAETVAAFLASCARQVHALNDALLAAPAAGGQ